MCTYQKDINHVFTQNRDLSKELKKLLKVLLRFSYFMISQIMEKIAAKSLINLCLEITKLHKISCAIKYLY